MTKRRPSNPSASKARVAPPLPASSSKTKSAAKAGSAGAAALAKHVPPSPAANYTWLPNALVLLVTCAAVAMGFTTSPEYVHSPRLLRWLRRSFVAMVCISNRTQLAHYHLPPNKMRTLKLLLWSHVKALTTAILANIAATFIVQPALGGSPQYAEVIQFVVPVYVGVEVILGLLRLPPRWVGFVVGLMVSWFKALAVSSLVLRWQQHPNASPLGFVLICTCNFSASALVIRYFVHYHASKRLVLLSLHTVWSVLKIMATSALIGLIAYGANRLSSQEERQIEATALYGLVAWYSLDKYWKPPLRNVLRHAQTTSKIKVKTA